MTRPASLPRRAVAAQAQAIRLGPGLSALLLSLLALSACGPTGDGTGDSAGGHTAKTSAPPLPGVAPDQHIWFWRDVLSEPQPGEAAPRRELLEIEPPVERVKALDALLLQDDPAALTTFMAALRDPRPGIAAAAADNLAMLGQTAALPRLIKGLGPYPVDYDVPIEVRAAEATALAQLGNPTGIPLILDILAEGTDLEADAATLPWTRTTRNAFTQELALPGLVALAGQDFDFHPMRSVPSREAAVTAARAWWQDHRLVLWAQAPVRGDGLAARIRLLVSQLGAYQLRQIDGARFTLTQLGPAVLPFIEEGLASDDDYQRLHGLEVLERLCDVSNDKLRGRLAVVASKLLLDESHPGIAAQAARVCGAGRVPDPLIVALQRRPESEVAVAVLDALGHSGRRTAAQVVLPLADGTGSAASRPAADLTRPDARAALAAAAFRLDPARGPETLLALLADADTEVAFAAIERLVDLTGDDCDLDPFAPAAERAAALECAAAALAAVPRRVPD